VVFVGEWQPTSQACLKAPNKPETTRKHLDEYRCRADIRSLYVFGGVHVFIIRQLAHPRDNTFILRDHDNSITPKIDSDSFSTRCVLDHGFHQQL
jgi:hypothetical protein